MPPKKKPEKRQLDVGSDGSDSDDPRPSKRLVLAPDADLPQSTRITFDQSEWLEQFREPFRNAIKPRGTKKDSATEYVYNTLTIPFIEKFFPQLNKEQVRRFRDCQWKPIYTWLSNHSSRDENAAKVPGSGQRFVVGWHWYADNKPEIKQQWREYCRDDDKKHLHSSIHHFRKFTLDLFAAQPPEVQLRYKNLTEELKQNASSRKELDPKSVEAALKDALHRLTTMGKGLESKFGITLMAQLGTPVAKTMRVVQAGSSTGLQFVLGEQGKAIGNAFGDWLVERFGGPQERSGSPQPAVMPDRIDNNHPMMPDVPEDIVTLMLARSWVRVFWSGRWQYDGGHDSVPYSLIAADPDRWVDPKRCPKGVPFKEAGQLNLAQCLEWVRHLSGRRNGTVDKEAEFGFRQILTANLDTYPTCPEVIERTQFVRNGRPVWLVRFSRLVKQPQNKKPIYYKRSSWLYFYHCEHERDPTISGTPGLAHWSGLPTRPADMDAGNGRFSHDEMNLIKSWFKNCEDGVKDLVDNIMAEVNVMEDRLPIWTENGIWDVTEDESPLPLLLPQSPPGDTPRAGLEYMREFWVRCEYFVAPTKKTPIEATHHSLEIWVHESLAGGPGFHAKSKTYVGGDNGTAWRIRVLLKYLASIGGTIPSTNVSAPSPIPVQYDPTRVSVHLWDAVIQWLNMWLSALIQSNIHLASSSNERCAPPGEKGIDDGEKNGEDLEAGGRTDDQEIPSVLSVDVVTPSPGSARRSKRPKPKPKTGPALPPTSEELDGLQQIDTDNVGHDGDGLGSTHAPNTTSRPRRKRKGKTAKQDAAKPPQPAAVTSGEPSQVPAQAAPAPLVVEGVGGLDGVLEAAVRARMALKPAQMATLKAEVIKELEEEGDFWVVERIKPLTKSVGRGEPPKWDKPRCALVENIPRFKNPLNTLDPSTLKPSLLKFIEDSKALIAEYLSMEAEYHLPYGRSCLVGSITRANDSAHCFPLLDQAIWQHGYHYAKCQAWWNGDLGDIFGDFHILYAEGSALLSRIQELAAKGEKCGLNDDILDLAELRTTQVQTYWCHGWKLLGLAKLWVNKHQECWLWSKDAWSLPDKVRLVNDLIAWEIQTTGLLKDLEASSEKDWAEAGYPPMLRPPSSWFLFGNPGPNAVDEAAKAQLIEAMKDLEERRASEEAKNDPPTPPPPIIHSPPTSAEQTQVPQQENKEPHATTVPKDDTLANLPMCLARSEDLAMQEGASQAPMDLDPPPPTLTLRPPEGVVEELGAGKAGGVDGADGPEVAVGHGGGASSAGDAGGEVEAAGAQTKGKGRGKGKATATVASQNAGPRTRKQQAAGVAKEPVRRSARTALPSKR